MTRWALLALLALIVLVPGTARAHGREPSLVTVAFHPTDADQVVIGATWGFLSTRDGGASWTWQCADVVFFDRTREDPSLAMFESGALLAGTYDGIRRSDDGRCGWSSPETAPTGAYAVDVVRDPTDADVAWAIVSPGIRPDTVHRSDDRGLTWSQVAEPHPTALTDRIRIAPSDPQRVYTSGVIPRTDTEPRRGVVLRSDDRGETFRAVELELAEGERTVHVLAVDPTDPDRLFARVVRLVTDELPERLLVSEDGGETWRTALEILEIVGFALSEDGTEAWAGSWDGGLYRSRDGGDTWEALDPLLPVRCLAHRPGELWVCADDRTVGFALARSRDGGETLEPVWRFADLEPDVGCPASTPVGERCPAYWTDMVLDLGLDTSMPFDGGVTADAGVAADGGGCACRGGTPARLPGAGLFGASLAALALARHHRRRRATRSSD